MRIGEQFSTAYAHQVILGSARMSDFDIVSIRELSEYNARIFGETNIDRLEAHVFSMKVEYSQLLHSRAYNII
jgi:hypothetical protein